MNTKMLPGKKLSAAIASVLCVLLARIGLDIDADTVQLLITPLLVFIPAQGIADFSKSRTQIELRRTELEVALKRAELEDKAGNVRAARDSLPPIIKG